MVSPVGSVISKVEVSKVESIIKLLNGEETS
jgi:hypothetical protein